MAMALCSWSHMASSANQRQDQACHLYVQSTRVWQGEMVSIRIECLASCVLWQFLTTALACEKDSWRSWIFQIPGAVLRVESGWADRAVCASTGIICCLRQASR